jgi:hypothetical protein
MYLYAALDIQVPVTEFSWMQNNSKSENKKTAESIEVLQTSLVWGEATEHRKVLFVPSRSVFVIVIIKTVVVVVDWFTCLIQQPEANYRVSMNTKQEEYKRADKNEQTRII